MGDYKPNHPSILLYERAYPRAEIRFNLAQTATEIRGKSETKLHPVAGHWWKLPGVVDLGSSSDLRRGTSYHSLKSPLCSCVWITAFDSRRSGSGKFLSTRKT